MDMRRRITLVYFIIFLTTNFIGAEIILCENEVKFCVCRFEHVENEDLSLLNIDCSLTHINILQNNYTLPKTVNTLTVTSNDIIKVIKTNMLNSITMKKLLLNKNNISNIETDSLYLPNLTHLDLSENSLGYFDPDIFRNTKKLKYLNLSNNRFKIFAEMAFHHLGDLEEIVLSGNDIGASLEATSLFSRNGLALNNGLKRLSIANINLNGVHDNLLTGYEIRYLKISNNNITTLPELPFTLEYLDFSTNPITEIYFEDFSNLLALKELHLNNLKIKEIGQFVFEPLKALKVLKLERNINLTKFSSLAFGKEVLDDADDFALVELSLRGSRITTLSDKLGIPFGQLHKLDLQGNRWKCDCKILWIRDLQIADEDKQYLRCYLPLKFYDTKLFSLEKDDFVCGQKKNFPLATVAVIAFCLIFGTMALWFFVFIPKYQSRGYNIQSYIYPSAVYNPVPTER